MARRRRTKGASKRVQRHMCMDEDFALAGLPISTLVTEEDADTVVDKWTQQQKTNRLRQLSAASRNRDPASNRCCYACDGSMSYVYLTPHFGKPCCCEAQRRVCPVLAAKQQLHI